MRSRIRPLSPFLHYRWQYTNTLSILHRLSGFALTIGFVLLVAGLIATGTGPSGYGDVVEWTTSLPGRLVLLVILTACAYHFCNGIRHLVWDAGLGLERAQARRSAHIVLIATLAIVLTVCALLAVLTASP
jgi:succinate dehydrogenase / fumarate reductase cytochrome b subunit